MPNRNCTVKDCHRKHYGRGYCSLHYRRMQRNGTTGARAWLRTLKERLEHYSEPQDNGCIYWTGYLNAERYGVVSNPEGSELAHKAAWEDINSPLPPGVHLDHICHSDDLSCPGGRSCLHRRCINVDHLEPTTAQENARRGVQSFERLGMCMKKLHVMTPDNIYVSHNGKRRCKPCTLAKNARYEARKTAQVITM